MDEKTLPNVPKKGCVINIMFPVTDDQKALAVKLALDETLKVLKEKRVTFQIIES